MKKYFYFFLFLLPIFASAQVPGYLGMKNSFGYEPSASIALRNPNSNFFTSSFPFGKPSAYVKYLAFNVTHTFSYEHLIQRNASLNTSFSFYKSGTVLDPFSKYDYAVSNQLLTYTGGATKISGYGLSLTLRIYNNDLAPMGLYRGFFLGFSSSSAMTHNSSTDSTALTRIKVFNPKFGYVYGRQNVFFNRFIVDRGVTFDLLGLSLAELRYAEFTDNTNATTPQEYFQRQIKLRMYWRDFISFYIGGRYLF